MGGKVGEVRVFEEKKCFREWWVPIICVTQRERDGGRKGGRED